MGVYGGPDIVEDGLVLCLDAGNSKSYPGSGNLWTDFRGLQTGITLENGPAYNSSNGGGIVFDGTDDYSRPTITHSYLQSSALEVIFNSQSHGSGFKTIFGYRQNGGYSLPTIGSIYLNNNTLSASVITTTQVYRTAIFPGISTGKFYHVVLNKDTVAGTLQLFVNGSAGSIQTFDASTYAQWNTVGSFIGANILDIAKSSNTNVAQGWGSDYFNGTIFKLSVYGRTLSFSEIAQNFAATRGRFGI